MAGNRNENGGYEKADIKYTAHMYSDRKNVNILTSLMIAHGIKTVVVCPGSRNAPLAHNFVTCRKMQCVAVTDERSAGFYAIGLAQASQRPVAVCVTSGTALLNLAPAVAEASLQNIPLLVVSSDRPQALIGQLQGQTLPQPGVFGTLAKCSVTLPEPHDEVEHWYCNRLVNEALLALTSTGGAPVHINVPVSEPLYRFTVASLPAERKISHVPPVADIVAVASVVEALSQSPSPMIVVGQMPRHVWRTISHSLDKLRQTVVVLSEKLSDDSPEPLPSLDMMAEAIGDDACWQPDTILYIGGHVVSKTMLHFLQHSHPRRSILVNRTGVITDVLMNVTDVVVADEKTVIDAAASACDGVVAGEWHQRWQQLAARCTAAVASRKEDYSQESAVRCFFHAIKGRQMDVHVANSMAVRTSMLFADRHLFVNRGCNGIEGSLSVAAGYSLMSPVPVACIIGDLSFFYDANALWHRSLCGNLRILLVNNGCGGIFRRFTQLEDSPAETYVMAHHNTSARGACLQNGVVYRQVTCCEDLTDGIRWLVETSSTQPMLLEVMI